MVVSTIVEIQRVPVVLCGKTYNLYLGKTAKKKRIETVKKHSKTENMYQVI